MKIALVSFDAFEARSTGYYPPIHLCTIGTALRRAGYDVKVFDYSAPFAGMESLFRSVAEFAPAIVGMTCFTPKMNVLGRVSRELRRFVPESAMVVGGPHPTAWPAWTLEHMPQFDYAIAGEADRAVVEFAEMIEGRREARDVKGLVYRSAGEIKCNPRDQIDDLGIIAVTDRSFLDEYYRSGMYWDLAARSPLDVMISSRGCPYDCSFCFKVERRYRYYSVDHVMAEFEDMRCRGIRSVHVQDDAFTANQKRCLAIADALIAGGYRFDIKVRGRVNSANERLLRRLREAGVTSIIYGFESGSQKMLDVMNKKTTVAQNREAVRITKKVGLACFGEIMIGLPGEDSQTVDETIQFLLETKPIIGFVPVLYPLPSTKVYEDAKLDGTLVGDWTVGGEWPWVRLPWAGEKREIERQAARINRAIQRDPGTVLYFFKSLWRKLLGRRQLRFLSRLALSHLRPAV